MENALINLFVELLGSEIGVSESQYDALLNVLSLSPLLSEVISEFLEYVSFQDGFCSITPEDASFILEAYILD